jgi:hypothetical protein
MKGLRLTVYRAAGSYPDCSNGGVSSKADVLTVVGRLVDGVVIPLPKGCCVFSPSDEAPAVVLVESRIARFDPTPHLIPLEFAEDGIPSGAVGPMDGGNYAGSCDSRWSDLGKHFDGKLRLDVVAIHDRIETYSDYLSLSR